jgi:3D (Asp-Asp-Asp) domain-containing protein
MAFARPGRVARGPAYAPKPRVVPRLWLALVAAVAVTGALVVVVGFERADATEAVALFRVSADGAAAPDLEEPVFPVEPMTAVPGNAVAVRPVSTTPTPPTPAGPQFNGMVVHPVRTMRMLVTAYCPCRKCCGKHADGITASGYSVWVNGGKMVAADTRVLPFGSLLSIPGYHGGEIVPVLDRGGKIKGRRLDVLFPSHRQAQRFGKRWVDVQVYALD